ncbi:type II toxin-antitoxin system PemK/MazF family toxin [Demequina sp. NBRC 110051]|uniref:type II toxin-antitoxin system PemK/MazF family toxin n=1 Tax=Demequina sp. NBRC 110051 TaxID=1570340 RepID=UPI0009FBFB52|nr:type II toxin-antitoxin system PemK/MazF family toxin [Demequina sp. NBRC 110051]
MELVFGVLAVVALVVAIALKGRRPAPPAGPRRAGAYPGDFTGTPAISYSPSLDGAPDPGEVVWTWVPFEEDYSQGKDRPVLLIGRDGRWLLGLMLTSKDHDHEGGRDPRGRRRWVDIGTGAWDRRGRPSEVRIDRVVRVDPAAVRREGAILDRKRFDTVVREAKTRQGW